MDDRGGGGPSTGPFDQEPVGLGRMLSEGFSERVPGDEIARRCERWLSTVLDDAGVTLGAFDRELIALIAAEGWSVAQVIGGWVLRASARRGL